MPAFTSEAYLKFLDKLRGTRREWRIDSFGGIRLDQKRETTAIYPMCPIVAVGDPHYGINLTAGFRLVPSLELTRLEGEAIMNAADRHAVEGNLSDIESIVRQDLLEACNLAPVAQSD